MCVREYLKVFCGVHVIVLTVKTFLTWLLQFEPKYIFFKLIQHTRMMIYINTRYLYNMYVSDLKTRWLATSAEFFKRR